MAFGGGVTPVGSEAPVVEELWATRSLAAREAGVVESGDRVVIAAGEPR